MKKTTARQDELIVLASMITPETAKNTEAVCLAAKLSPAEMFTTPFAIELYDVIRRYGPETLGGYVDGTPAAKLATINVKPYVDRIVANYKRRLAATDRTLDTFETPGRDEDDPDCLFQHRWLRRGACGAIVSTSGVGKSSFSMQAAATWAGGAECLGIRPMKPLKIGIFQSEDDEYDVANFRDRIRIGLRMDLGWTAEQITAAESRVTFCALDGTTGLRFVEYLREKQTRHHFDLIIINPLFAFFGGDLNDGDSMTTFLRHGIDQLIKAEETKCGCIIIHHTGKPNKEALNQGEAFRAYVGSGSSEFTNYIRSALVITPWNSGKVPGVFDLIAAKHGDKLGWRDSDGKLTNKKTICYANKLAEYADSGAIYWVEPDAAQFDAIKQGTVSHNTPGAPQVSPVERCADILAEHIKKSWTALNRPLNAPNGQRDWCIKLPRELTANFQKSTKGSAYDLIMTNPSRWGLEVFKPGERRRPYFIAAIHHPTNPTDNINPEQEDFPL